MAQSFKIKFTDKQTGKDIIFEGEFPDEEWERLLDFSSLVDKLIKSKILGEGISVNLRINYSISSGIRYENKLPDDDDVATLLHRMRPFILQKERTSFYSICSILSRRLSHSHFRAVIERQRAEFSGKHFQGLVDISANGVTLNSDEILNKWLNGYEYHHDLEKQGEIEALHQLFPLESSRAIFINMIMDKAKAVSEIDRIIQGFKKRGGIELQFRTYKKENPNREEPLTRRQTV